MWRVLRKKRPRALLAFMIAALLISVVWKLGKPTEPNYKDKDLLTWLRQYAANDESVATNMDAQSLRNEAESAIRQIGTNALPLLLKLSKSHDSALKHRLILLSRRQSLVTFHFYTDRECHVLACNGFLALKSLASPTVASLIPQLTSKDDEIRATATISLGGIGPDAEASVSALVQQLRDKNNLVRAYTIEALTKINRKPEIVVPALVETLSASNSVPGDQASLRRLSLDALGDFHSDARPAVPSIVPWLTDGDYLTRELASNALRKIDPEAAAKSVVK